MKKILLSALVLFTITAAKTQPPAGAPPKPPTREERLKHVSEKFNRELKLTASQQQKIKEAFSSFFDGMDALRQKEQRGEPMPPPPPPPPADRAAAERLTKARDAKVKAVLTPAQYQQYIDLEKTMRPKPRH